MSRITDRIRMPPPPQPEQPSLPPGYALVPRKPTLEMIAAGMKAGASSATVAWEIFAAMTGASTSPDRS